jgi:hypothetical protein
MTGEKMENFYCVTVLTRLGFQDEYEWGETATEAIANWKITP